MRLNYMCSNTSGLMLVLLISLSCSVRQTAGPTGTAHRIVPSMATWHMDTTTISLTAKHSPFNVLVNLRSLGRDKDLMDDAVHDEIKKVAEHGVEKGVLLVADIDL